MKKVGLWFLAVVVVLLLSWPLIARQVSRVCLRRLTGVAAEVHSAKLGWRHGQFEVRDFACTNLVAGSALINAKVPRLQVQYEPASIFRRELHIYDIACEIQKLTIVHQRSESGRGRTAHSADTVRPVVRVDALHLKLDGAFAYDNQQVTGKMEATLNDVQNVESLRALLKKP